MPSIDPMPRAGAEPLQASFPVERSAVPQAQRQPVPPGAGTHRRPSTGDYIALGVGLAGLGALGFAAAGGAAATEGLAVGAATLLKSAGTAAKAFGPQLVEDWRAGAATLKDATGVGQFAAKQSTAALSDFARAAVVGSAISAGAEVTRHVAHAIAPPKANAKVAPDCAVKP